MSGTVIPFIDLKTQFNAIESDIRSRIDRVLAHGQYVMGPEVGELESRLAEFVGVKHCISASSGTDTLLIALMALGVGAGTEVITSPFTFVATGEVIALLGATPVFVDIDSMTYNIDPTKIEEAITSQTRAIMPVSLFGQCADMDEINRIADRHGLPVVEDGAQSFGATYKGRRSCALSTVGSTSFFPSKPLGAYGDGGALFTDDSVLAKAMREIRVHGQVRRYHHERIGINGRLDTLQAAILLAKLDRFEWEIAQRWEIGTRYTAMIESGKFAVTTPYIEPHNQSVYAQYTVQIDERDAVSAALKQVGVPTTVHYPLPLHQQPAFHRYVRRSDLSASEKIARRVISLPMGPDLTLEDQQRVVRALFDTVQ